MSRKRTREGATLLGLLCEGGMSDHWRAGQCVSLVGGQTLPDSQVKDIRTGSSMNSHSSFIIIGIQCMFIRERVCFLIGSCEDRYIIATKCPC